MTEGWRRLTAAAAAAAALGGCAQVREGVQRVTNRNAVVAAPACQDFSFPIYFETGADRLTAAALQVIDDNSARVRACRVAQLNVTGLADADGSAADNLELSRRRATAVARALAARGYPAPSFEVAAAGEAGATGPRGTATPMRRVAQVSVRFAAATPGAR